MKRRIGTAPLEFVLVFPLLITIMVVGWYVGSIAMTRTQVASEARKAAWAKRVEADPGVPFDFQQSTKVGYVEVHSKKDVPRRSPITQETETAEAFANVVFETWQYDAFPFPELPKRISPHIQQLKHFGKFIPLIARFMNHMTTSRLIDPKTNPKAAKWATESAQLQAKWRSQVPVITIGIPSMAAAMMELISLAARVAYVNPPLAAWYLYEASVIAQGLAGASQTLNDISRR